MIGYSTWIGSKNVEIIVASENEKKNGEKFREIDSFHLKIFLAAELFLNFLVQCVNNSSSMW